MKKFKVNATMMEYGYFEVFAKNEDEARDKVLDDEEHFVSTDAGCDIEEIELIN
jgi:hypothetical protein